MHPLSLTTVALLVMLSATSPPNPRSGGQVTRVDPCPPPEVIAPCICSEYVVGAPSLQCDDVDIQTLDLIFLQDFPVSNIDSLTIRRSSLGHIPADIFHGKTVSSFRLTGCGVTSMDESFLDDSRETLTEFFVNDNNLKNVSLQNVYLFPHLRYFYLTNNQLRSIDALVGMPEQTTLKALYVGRNYITSLHPDVFKSVPGVAYLQLEGNRLTALAPKIFYPLYRLESLALYDNTILHLSTGDLWLSTPILRTMDLRNNGPGLTFDPDVFRGVANESKVDLGNNGFRSMEYEVFGGILKNVSTWIGFVDLNGNLLDCDCSILWLVMDEKMLSRAFSAMCKNYTYVSDLDRDVMIDNCATNPMLLD